jgi:AmmeMemoRadiSam system protein B
MFYPADPQQCRALARQLTSGSDASFAEETTQPTDRRWLGGVVPHAGWICSGAIAGQTLATIAAAVPQIDLVVVFGAIHTPIPTDVAALDSFKKWDVPGGEAFDVAGELRSRMIETSTVAGEQMFVVDDRFHRREHAVEVELPLIRSVWPNAIILPIEVPANEDAAAIGRATARVVRSAAAERSVVYLASSDLTHYGPAYGYAPAGVGPSAMSWAKENDRPLIDAVLAMQDEASVPQVRARRNACGAGAIAAMLAACKQAGAKEGRLLRHANSFETLADVAPQPPDNAVGYAAIVVG